MKTRMRLAERNPCVPSHRNWRESAVTGRRRRRSFAHKPSAMSALLRYQPPCAPPANFAMDHKEIHSTQQSSSLFDHLLVNRERVGRESTPQLERPFVTTLGKI